MILAAGLGTRLRPLTDTTPKALMEVDGRPILQIVAERLIGAGVTDIVVNVHHHASLMRQAIRAMARRGVRFHISDESDGLLDTGGGLLHARALLDGDAPFFVYNIDILSGIRLDELYAAHLRSDALATLAVSDRPTNRFFLWDGELLAGWENTDTRELVLCRPAADHPKGNPHPFRRKAFSGIAVINPQIFELIEERGAFSIKDMYLRLACQWPVRCYAHDHRSWFDIGTPEKLEHARKHYRLTLNMKCP